MAVVGFATLGLTVTLARAEEPAGFDLRSGPILPAAAPTAGGSLPDGGLSRHAATAPQAAYTAWAAVVAARTGVPARALTAYAVAARRAAAETPDCRLDWATLAGIGYVESRSGAMGAGLRASGAPRRPIYGVQLDGSGPVADVADSDDGRLDDDATADRAVGPLQFLPSTWVTWGSDGDGDGVRDPQDLDDAAVAAARYLCAAGPVDTAEGWTAAVLSYNPSTDYLNAVFAATQAIADRS